LSVLGPWPWYIAGIAAVGFVMLLVLQGIAELVRRGERRTPGAAATPLQS
jgi:TRAP-type mannitol/chloroaromatic compound transport system permease small subunit